MHLAVHHALFLLVSAGSATAQQIERVSTTNLGVPANRAVEVVARPSDDGRYVVFSTTASNLVPGDGSFSRDVFRRDRLLGTTVRIAVGSVVSDVSSDGRLVLVYRNSSQSAILLDLVASSFGPLGNSAFITRPGTFSRDGRFLTFTRAEIATSGPRILLRREIATSLDDVVSITQSGTPNTEDATPGRLSADGSLVTFETADPDIVPGDTNGKVDAFYRDLSFGFTDRYSVDVTGGQLAGDSSAGSIDGDTRYILYTTESPALQTDTNGTWDLYVADRYLGELRRANVGPNAAEANAPTQSPNAWVSPDGTRVLFDSPASNLVANDNNAARDVFEHDFSTATTRRIVLGVGGAEPNQDVSLRGVSGDGRYLTLTSAATNLVTGPQSAEKQAYIVDLGPQCSIVNYCTAQPNSTGVPALIQSTGTASLSLNNFVLSALDLPDSSACVFFHGTSRLEPAAPFGDGLRCVGGTVKRLGTLQSSEGVVIQFQDLSSLPYANVQPGDVRRFQLLYRDSASSGAGFNTTAAIEVTFCP